mgnify:FL=1
MMTFQQLIFLLYQNKLYQRPDSLLAQIYLKNFIIFRLILFTVRLKIENFGMVIIFMLLMVLNSNFQIQNPILNFWVKCSDTLIIPDDLPWDLLLLYMMYLMITLFMLHLFHHYLASERSAAIEHLKSLETLNIYENSVVIFDRGYYSEKLFSYCVEHGHMCLMRLKETYNIFIIGFMKRLLPKILCTISTIDEINRLYSEAVRNRSQIMLGRTFKRKKNKAKERTHFNNQIGLSRSPC